MTQDQLDVAHRHAEVLQQRRCGVASVVHRDARQVDRLADLVEGPHEVLGVYWSTGSAVEHQFVCTRRPFVAEREKATPEGQEQRQITSACGGLDWASLKDPADALELLLNVDDVVLEVDVAPAKPQHFAAAHAVGEQQEVAQRPAVTIAGVEEGNGLLIGPRRNRLALVVGQIDQTRDVAVDEFLLESTSKCRRQDRAHAVERLDGAALGVEVIYQPLDIQDAQLRQLPLPDVRHDVQAHGGLVELGRARSCSDRDDGKHPVFEVTLDAPVRVRDGNVAARLLKRSHQLVPCFVVRSCIEAETSLAAASNSYERGALPATVLALGQGAFSIGSPTHGGPFARARCGALR